jgi:hypothetical protein
MKIKHLTMAIRALRVMDHQDAPDWADKADDELKALLDVAGAAQVVSDNRHNFGEWDRDGMKEAILNILESAIARATGENVTA